jgi:hypothetical protein
MKNIFSLLIFSSALSSNAQITVDEADFPVADDTAMISISNDLSADFATTGADVTWDFSALTIDNQRIDTFYNVSSASLTYQVVYNNWITEPEYESEYYNTTDELSFDGIPGLSLDALVEFTRYPGGEVQKVGWGMNIGGVELPAKATEIDTEYDLPLNFSNTWTSTYFVDVDLNPAYNAIFRRHQDRSAEVDGWGTLITPFGTFDVIRIKTDLTYNDSIYIGDFDIWTPLPTPDRHEYTWWTNGQKVPMMKIITSGSGPEAVTQVEFKDKNRGFIGISESEVSEFKVYPVPSCGTVNFAGSSEIQGIEIYNALGETVLVDTPGSVTFEINILDWKSGVYFAKIQSGDSESVLRFVR